MAPYILEKCTIRHSIFNRIGVMKLFEHGEELLVGGDVVDAEEADSFLVVVGGDGE